MSDSNSSTTPAPTLATLLTEARYKPSEHIDELSTTEMLQVMNTADREVAGAVGREIPAMARAVDAIAAALAPERGGRLFYVGAGTSGRLGVLDASECPPTFNVPASLVQGFIAGGDYALRHSIEGAEDSHELGATDLRAHGFTAKDVLVGIAASGRTPYVLGAMEHAKSLGAITIGLSCVPASEVARAGQIAITPAVGPEVITGSTRLRAGTATKLVLNMLSTGTMIRLGTVYGNLMVNVQPTNGKLADRAERIVVEITGLPREQASALLAEAGIDQSCCTDARAWLEPRAGGGAVARRAWTPAPRDGGGCALVSGDVVVRYTERDRVLMSSDTIPTAVMSASQSEASGTKARTSHHLRRFRFDRPQKIAALLLLLLLAQCVRQIVRTPLTDKDYQYARCGREMWERPSAIGGYFTSCGNIHDGVLAYRMAGLPLTLQRLILGQGRDTSTWEMRHELSYVRFLLRFPFTLAALLLGGALWWVTRRLFGNPGGFVALAFYCVSPAIVAAGSQPNAEITTALGIFATIYTAIGVAHAMQGPRRKWRPRIVLLAAGLALVAASHSAALLLTLPLALIFMVYLAERNRTAAPMVMVAGTLGAFILLFACYAFHPDAVSYYFRSGAGRIGISTAAARAHLFSFGDAGIAIALAAALALYVATRRSRYFGNTTPLLIALCFLPLVTTGVFGQPWLWAIPFLMAFIGGVFADALETRHARIFGWAVVAMVALQAVLTVALPALP